MAGRHRARGPPPCRARLARAASVTARLFDEDRHSSQEMPWPTTLAFSSANCASGRSAYRCRGRCKPAAARWHVPLVLIDLHTEEGITGSTYLFCYTPPALKPVAALLRELAPLIEGHPLAPFEIERRLQRQFRLLGAKPRRDGDRRHRHGRLGRAARARGVPLARLLGGDLRPIAPTTASGLGMVGPREAPAEAERLVEGGFRAVKLRLGYPTRRPTSTW